VPLEPPPPDDVVAPVLILPPAPAPPVLEPPLETLLSAPPGLGPAFAFSSELEHAASACKG